MKRHETTLVVWRRNLAWSELPPTTNPRGQVHLGGLLLRYVLTDTIWRLDRAVPVGELCEILTDRNFIASQPNALPRLDGTVARPSKLISDALRWEVKRGRIVRPRRAAYAPGTMPRQTRSRIRNRVARLDYQAAAARL